MMTELKKTVAEDISDKSWNKNKISLSIEC